MNSGQRHAAQECELFGQRSRQKSVDANQIRTASDEWVRAFNAKNGAGSAAVYTADAVLLPPDAAPIEGLEAISGFWGEFASSVESASLKI